MASKRSIHLARSLCQRVAQREAQCVGAAAKAAATAPCHWSGAATAAARSATRRLHTSAVASSLTRVASPASVSSSRRLVGAVPTVADRVWVRSGQVAARQRLLEQHRHQQQPQLMQVRYFGILDRLREGVEDLKKGVADAVEQNEELKKSVEELKKSGLKDDIDKASQTVAAGAAKAREAADKARKAAEKAAASDTAAKVSSTFEKVKEKAKSSGEGGAADASSKAQAAAGKAKEAAAKAKSAAGRAREQVEDSEFYRGARAKLGSAQEKVKEKAEATAKKHSKVTKTLQDTGNVLRAVFGMKKRRSVRKTKEELEKQPKVELDKETTAVVMVERQKSTWERVTEKLRRTPIISSVLNTAEDVAQSEAAQEVKDAVKDKVEDVRETWETSQNPWVYRTSAALDSVFSENEWGVTLREVKQLDAGFDLPSFLEDVKEEIAPAVITAFLQGDREELEYWCTEEAMERLNAALAQRQELQLHLDPHILDLKADIVTARVVENQPAVLVCQVMAQQINCVRNGEGEIVEGSEDEIRAHFYMMAMQRVWHEKRGELAWQVAELMVIGNQLYL